MQKSQYFFLVFIILSLNLNAQNKGCRVLKNGLDETYKGDCKKGLAQGSGTAKGRLGTYVGEFKKGFPHGSGKLEYLRSDVFGAYYTGDWIRGMRDGKGVFYYSPDSIMDGYWQKDKYIGPYEYPYKVTSSRGPIRYKFTKIADAPNVIEIQFRRGGLRTMDDIVTLRANSNSGSQLEQQNFFGFEQVEYPFVGQLSMTLNNKLRTNTFTADFDFTVYQKGKWIVTIDY